ncbi:MAG TPA: M56 family metallopeptidase [Isosphaeraceae bacterium]|jgi:beta-lactamase regulating signal transducer with metallopeptidase domain|nr:M56 family metallopeptidase [Isosphaeraceae bacterium]
MNALLRVGLTNAAIAAALGVVAFVVARAGRRPALGHCLWLIVLLKLVSPPLWGVPMPWPQETAPAPTPAVVPRATTIEQLEAELAVLADLPDVSPAEPARPTLGERARAWWADGTIGRAAAVAWLAGSACWFVFMGLRIGRFQRLLRHAEPADEALQGRADELAGRMGLTHWPEVRVLPIAVSPLLWAVAGRARLVVPGPLWKQLGAAERDALLAHELAHLKRRDHWARWVELVAVGLHWWNPVAWWARRELERAEEACCDAWVVRALPGSAKAYAKALLKTVDFLAESRPAFPPAASGAGRIPNLKRRVTMILRETLEHRLGAPARLAALAIGLLVLPLAPRPSPAQDPAPKPEAGPIEVEARVVLDELVGDDGAVVAELAEVREQAEADAKDKGDLEARMRRLEERLEKLAAILEAKGGDGVSVRFTQPEKADGVVVIRREDLKRLDAVKAKVARLAEVQLREAKMSAKLADEAMATATEKPLDRAKADAERAAKQAEARHARLGVIVERLDEKAQKDTQALQGRVLSLRLPGFDEEQAKKLAAEIDELVKKHAEAGEWNNKLAEEIQALVKKRLPDLDKIKQEARATRSRVIIKPDAGMPYRVRMVEPAKPGSVKEPTKGEGLDQRMDRLEKRLDELMSKLENKLEKRSEPSSLKP